MGLIATPTIGRRRFVAGGIAAAGTLILPAGLAAEAGLVATPRTTAGPFYPVKFPPTSTATSSCCAAARRGPRAPSPM